MDLGLDSFCDLVKNKRLELRSGVFLTCDQEINTKIWEKDGVVNIDFGAPYVFLHIEELGPVTLKNVIRPRVLGISISSDTITLKLKTFPDFTIEREKK